MIVWTVALTFSSKFVSFSFTQSKGGIQVAEDTLGFTFYGLGTRRETNLLVSNLLINNTGKTAIVQSGQGRHPGLQPCLG